MGLLDWLKGKGSSAAPDGFALRSDDPYAPEQAAISQVLLEYRQAEEARTRYGRTEHGDLDTYKAIAALDREAQARMIHALAQRLSYLQKQKDTLQRERTGNPIKNTEYSKVYDRHSFLGGIVAALLRKRLPLGDADLQLLLQWCAENRDANPWDQPISAIVNAIENFAAKSPLSEPLKKLLASFQERLDRLVLSKEYRKPAARVAALLGRAPKFPMEPGEAWSDAALAYCQALPVEEQAAWIALLEHCADATSSSPSAKWRKAAAELLAEVGREDFKRALLVWFPLVNEPRTGGSPLLFHGGHHEMILIDPHMDLLRGLAWICGLAEDRELARALTSLAISAFKKVPGIGPRATRVGNACITALGMMPGLDAVGQLALLKVKVKFGTAQAAIDKALNAAAEREGLPRTDLEEMSVPAYGLTEVGRLVEPLGEFTAELVVTGPKTVELIWRRPDGQVQKSLPTAVKKEFADDLKDLNAAKKDIEKMLPAQAERIDAMFLQQKSWRLDTWLERYLQHPLVGVLARRLLWVFTTDEVSTPGVWLNGKLVDRLAHPIALEERTTVSLWHPLYQAAEVVLGWRAFLEEWEIRQPFKQAHREVYLLTPAEENTRTYSNRFASHILKQHQFHALCAARGWKNKLRLMVDDEYPPATRVLPQWGLRAEFWIEGAGDEFGADTNDSGTFLYLTTDQVRFYPLEVEQVSAHAAGGGYSAGWQRTAAEPLPLAEVPPLVFSEIMRDVDLFVGVTSVGNDPAWADGGRDENARHAWDRFSFGELSATAETRRDLLQRLVPKLKIAARCSFAERFLVVRGDLRTYKIHLGSGNILMSPNDQYLCIVPGSAGKAEDGKMFLPFEGDRTLSVILSKAFLLAADAKITDITITRQIR